MTQWWIVGYLDGLAGQVMALARPRLRRGKLQSETAPELDALLPRTTAASRGLGFLSILDKAFKGEL
jgi:hypothetical protein